MIKKTTPAPRDLIDTVIRAYENVESYQVTLKSSDGNAEEEIKYYFRAPGYVKMEFIRPHKGAVLVYNPIKKEARLKPFGFLSFFVLTLNPDTC